MARCILIEMATEVIQFYFMVATKLDSFAIFVFEIL